MISIKEKTPGRAWLKACSVVIENGKEVKDGEVNLKELIDLYIEVERACNRDEIIKKFSDKKMIDWMVKKNFCGNKPVLNWGYCYGLRLNNYNGVNQIKKIIEKLKKNPEAKSATISTMKPDQDFDGHLPCVICLDFKIRNNKLHLTSFFRSQDIGKKIYADILALGEIQKIVSQKLGVKCGMAKLFISSAHIYETEFGKVNELLSRKPI